MTLKVFTQTTFSQEIEKIVRVDKLTYFEAVCEYMEKNNLEPEKISKLLNVNIKQKIEAEAIDLNLIYRGKKPSKLF
jgi:hypothetical protein